MRQIFIGLNFLLLATCVSGQNSNLLQQVRWIRELAETKHIEPRKIDDAFSSSVFDHYLSALDADKVYFTADDIKSLEKYRLSIDDEFKNQNVSFFTASARLYKDKLQQVSSIITTHCSKPFDFNLAESYDAILDTSRALNEKQLSLKWYYILKSDVLQVLANAAGTQLQTNNAINKAEILGKEAAIRNKVMSRYLNQIKHLLSSDQEFEKEISSIYLNSFLACFDPHSSFFDVTARQNFESHLDTEAFFFGFTLMDNDKGEVTIIQLHPGGPAWLSGMLHKDDVLLAMKWANKDLIDLAGMNAGEVSALMDQSNTEKLELTVRKGNGKIETVVLQKRKLENDENIVKSYVLKGNNKIGYITLPSFYTGWEDASGSKCAADVAKEVMKLKKDSIEGLILDLRFNGGGSLQEAIEMAGIFIDEGAVGQLRTKDPKITVMKDMNRGVIYSGPLLLMVNGQSASASELLAACLQDYNRAVIAGSQTFGKATGQQIMPVHASNEQYGSLKLTTLKLYRVDGSSIQGEGVKPDIIFPDVYEGFTESAFPSHLKKDTVAAYKYFKSLKALPKAVLHKNAAERMAKDQRFALLASYKQVVSNALSSSKASLKWDVVVKEIRAQVKANTDFERAFLISSPFYVPVNNSSDQKFITASSIAQEVNQQWLERISKDMYTEQCYQILADLIKLNTN